MKSSALLLSLLLLANPAFAKISSNADEPAVCPKTQTVGSAATAQESDTPNTAPAAARATPARTRSTTTRTVSPRWHSMLPGMFR